MEADKYTDWPATSPAILTPAATILTGGTLPLSLHEVLESIGEGFMLLDRGFRILEVNAEMLRLDRRKREELIGQSCWQAYPGAETGELGRLCTKVMHERVAARLEQRQRWPDGRDAWLEIRACPISEDSLALFWRDITRHREADQQLKDSEARFRTAIEAIHSIVWTNDAEGRMTGEQPSWAQLTGQSFEDYQGYGWSKVIHPDDVQPTIDAWHEAVTQKRPFEFEHRLKRRDGQWRRFKVRAVAVPALDGTIREWVGVHTDITDERMVSTRFRQLADNINEVFYILNLDELRIEYISPAYERVWQRAAQEIQAEAMSYLKAIHPDDLGVARQALARQQSGLNTDIRYRLVNPDGSVRHIHDRAFVTRDPDSGVRRVVGIAEDVTLTTEARLQLMRNAQTFETLLRNNPFGIYIVDHRFRLYNFSQGSRKVFSGIDPLLGRDFGEILRLIWAEPFASEAIAHFRKTLETGKPYINTVTIEERANIKATEAYDWRIERIALPDGTYGVVCYFYDLSERMELEGRLRQALDDKDLLMREIDHRVRNSLAIISSLLSMQRSQVSQDETRDALAAAASRVNAIARIHDRLYKSKVTGIVDFGDYLTELCNDIDKTLRRDNLTFEVNTQPVDLAVEKAVPLGMVANELITNACKYSLSDNPEKVMVTLTKNGEQLVFTVTDTGAGVAADFDPKRATGLGLKIIDALVRQIGGSITYPNPGTQARFSITAPLH